jgi:8-oxo-dGTP pyrophosphatase MutT (NUDIX family)
VLEAAVLIPVVLAHDPYIVFVRRGAHLRRNPGQIAFPGGLLEPGESPEEGAARECHEEIGIDPARLRITGSLAKRGTVGLTVAVVPIVATVAPPVELRIDNDEVERVFEVPLAAVFAPDAVHPGKEPFNGLLIPTWQFDYGEMHVWGATGRILRDFVERYGPAGDELTRSGLLDDRRK